MAVGVTVGFIETGVVAAVAEEADETVAAVGRGGEKGHLLQSPWPLQVVALSQTGLQVGPVKPIGQSH